MVKNFCFYLTHKDVSKCYKRHLCAQDVLQCILESFFPLYWNKFSSENYGRLSPCSNLEVCLRRVLSMLCILFGFPPIVACVAGVSKNLTKVDETGRECEKIRSRGRSEASDSFLHTPSPLSTSPQFFAHAWRALSLARFFARVFDLRLGKKRKRLLRRLHH